MVIDLNEETQKSLQRGLGLETSSNFKLFPKATVAPGLIVPVVYKQAVIKLENMVWGFLPIWDSKEKKLLPNARIETAEFKPTFANAYVKNRCLIPVSAYYEWKKIIDPLSGKIVKKEPYIFRLGDGKVFCIAGLYNVKEKNGAKVFTFTVLTKDATEEFKEIHDRMPVVINENLWQEWLDEDKVSESLKNKLINEKFDLVYEKVVTKV